MLNINKLIHPKLDKIKKGKCCENIKSKNFSAKLARYHALKNNITGNNILTSNYCLELLVPGSIKWRVCSDKLPLILKLQTMLTYSIIKSNNKKLKFLQKFWKNSQVNMEQEIVSFSWDNQKNWGNNCRSDFLQSPIDIQTPIKKRTDFKIEYNFFDVNVKIIRRFNENVVVFLNNPGLLKFTYSSNMLIFRPKYISFRFPSEHLINGKRYPGEMIIHFKELHPDKVLNIYNRNVELVMD